jgi:hypothetical protein
MSRITQLLQLIPQSVVTEEKLRESGMTCDEAIAELLDIFSTQSASVKTAFVHVLLRALETFILADHELLNLARYHQLFLGRESEYISDRVGKLLGAKPPDEFVSYLQRCLTSFAATNGGKAGLSSFLDKLVLQNAIGQHPRREIRCAICGYHFRASDVGSRLDIIEELDAVLAETIEPRRLEDELKPAIPIRGNTPYTLLELDHVVPEEGFGWTEADNIQIACRFCNGGRLIFRRGLEPVSTMVAGSLGAHPPSRTHRMTRQVIIVSKLVTANGVCAFCGKSRQDVELTVQLRDEHVASRMWFVPWNLEVTCYECQRS